MDSIFVSIIIPVYNRSSTIVATLNSVEKQTYQNWECFIVDDFSTDDLVEKAKSWDCRFKYVLNKRTKGAPGARNTGIENASGDYIIFLDSDDFLTADCLEQRLKYVKEDESLDFLISYQKRLENGVESYYINIPSDFPDIVRFFCLNPPQDIPWVNNMLFIKREFLLKHKLLWDETLQKYQDIQFHLDLLLRDPNYKWANHDADCYWTIDEKKTNIGSLDPHNEVHKIEKLIEVYWDTLCRYNGDSQVLRQMKLQYHSMLSFYLFKFANTGDAILKLAKEKSQIKSIHRLLLHIYTSIAGLKKRYYVHRLIARKIKEYIEGVYKPVITNGTFLKVTQLL